MKVGADKAVEFLKGKGENAFAENGVVMVSVSKKNYTVKTLLKIQQELKEIGYFSSVGIRLKEGELKK